MYPAEFQNIWAFCVNTPPT